MKKILVLVIVVFVSFGAWAQVDTTAQEPIQNQTQSQNPTQTQAQTQTGTEVKAQGQEANASQSSVPMPKSLRTKSSTQNTGTSSSASGGSKIRPQIGGNFGITASGYSLGLVLQPQFGLYFTKWLLWGLTGTYILTYDWNINKAYNTFGLNTYFQAYAFKRRLILHAGYEYLNYPYSVSTDGSINREDSHVVLAGLGYRGYVSAKVSLYALALFPVYQYNSNQHYYYSQWYIPTIRMGVSYDF